MTIEELTAYIKEYALEHYEDGGWDVIVECWDDAGIAKVLREHEATDEEEAVHAFSWMVSVWGERQRDAEISSGEYKNQ